MTHFIRFFGVSVLLLTGLFLSCNDKAPVVIDTGEFSGSPAATSSDRPVFTPEETRRLEELRAGGGLKVSTAIWPTITEENPNGGYTGFQYELLVKVAEYLELPISLEIQEMEDFFRKDGSVPEDLYDPEGEPYTPDALVDADLILHNLVLLDWRKKFMDVVPTISTKLVIITREGEPLVQLGDLSGKTGIVLEFTRLQDTLEDLNADLGLDIDIKAVPSTANDIDTLLAGEGDFCLRPSSFILGELQSHDGLAISMAFGEEQRSGWAVKAGDAHLKSVLSKALNYLKSGSEFENLFRTSFDIHPDEYHSLIRCCDSWKDSLTDSESVRLQELRDAGGLRAAIYREHSVYE